MNSVQYYDNNGNNLASNPGQAGYLQVDPFQNLLSPNENLPFPSSNLIKLSPRKVSYQPNTLGNTVHIYISPLYQDMISLADYFADWSCSYEIQEGPTHTFTVQVPWDTITNEDFNVSEYSSETWEIVATADQQSIVNSGLLANSFVAPNQTGNYVVLPNALKVAVQQAYENKTSTINVTSNYTGSSIPTGFLPYAQTTLSYLRLGVEGIPSYGQTLRRTAIIDERNQNHAFQTAQDFQNNSYNNSGTINYILSTPDMVKFYPIPTDTVATFLLPSYSVNNSVSYDTTKYYSYAGWLVKPPTYQFLTRNKVILNQEFVWGTWLSGLYYIASPVTDFPLVNTAASIANQFQP